ncbi:hypothetical protein AB0I81_12690 [Nonomuraea sp. NPDC050404]
MAELEREPGEREGDIHWYDLPDDEAEEDWVRDIGTPEGGGER